jgi:ribosomal-protein-serine acetyltransferase
MTAHPPVTLRGPRLLLRAFKLADAPAFVEAVRESVDSVGRWMPWCHAQYSLDEARLWIGRCLQAWASGGQHEFGFFDAHSGRLLGGGGLNGRHADLPQANLGYWVRQSAQRQGLAVEATGLLAQHGFADLGLQRLEIVVAQGNAPSATVAQRAGAQCEGLLRRRVRTPQGLEDAWMYALTANDAAAAAATAPPVAVPAGFAPRGLSGCYAVIFTSTRTAVAAGYGEAAQHMVDLASQQPGFLGVESARGDDGLGITVSYWQTLADIAAWRRHAEHAATREQGRAQWYSHYELRVVQVQRAYGWDAAQG